MSFVDVLVILVLCIPLQQLDQLNTSSKKLKEDLEAREKAAMARAEAAEGVYG